MAQTLFAIRDPSNCKYSNRRTNRTCGSKPSRFLKSPEPEALCHCDHLLAPPPLVVVMRAMLTIIAKFTKYIHIQPKVAYDTRRIICIQPGTGI